MAADHLASPKQPVEMSPNLLWKPSDDLDLHRETGRYNLGLVMSAAFCGVWEFQLTVSFCGALPLAHEILAGLVEPNCISKPKAETCWWRDKGPHPTWMGTLLPFACISLQASGGVWQLQYYGRGLSMFDWCCYETGWPLARKLKNWYAFTHLCFQRSFVAETSGKDMPKMHKQEKREQAHVKHLFEFEYRGIPRPITCILANSRPNPKTTTNGWQPELGCIGHAEQPTKYFEVHFCFYWNSSSGKEWERYRLMPSIDGRAVLRK